MSTVAARLFGAPPKHLKLCESMCPFELTASRLRNGSSIKVIPTTWWQKGYDGCYYQIRSVTWDKDIKSGTITGSRFWNHKLETKRVNLTKPARRLKWALYEPPSLVPTIQWKLGLASGDKPPPERHVSRRVLPPQSKSVEHAVPMEPK